MKFKHKVYDHKRKVGIDFRSCGPNSLGTRANSFQVGPNRGPKLNFVLFQQKMNIWGSLIYAESNHVFRFLIFGPGYQIGTHGGRKGLKLTFFDFIKN